jgi:tetratricopeptide (TPR) repeat protein
MVVVALLCGILVAPGRACAQQAAPAQPGAAAADAKAESAKAYVTKGRDLHKAQKYQEAIEAFQKAAELDPANNDGWDGQWDALNALNRPADASAVLDKWVQTQPNNRQAWTYKMMMDAMAKRPAEALKACDKLIELDPTNGDYYCGRGNMLRALGRNDEALAAFEKACILSRNPIVRADAWRAGVALLTQQGKHADVVTWCTKAIEQLPPGTPPRDVAVPWYRRAAARALTGDTVNALSDLKKAVYLEPDYKKQAAKDPAFTNLRDGDDFKNLRPEPPEPGFKLTAEWKALNRLVGDWDVQETVTVPVPKQGRGSRTATWTLGDRYLVIKATSGLDNSELMVVATYDPDRQAIREWVFSSLWAPGTFSVRWDEQTNTFTFKGEDAGPTTLSGTDHFLDEDHHELTLTVKDSSGKVLFAATSEITRRKK